LRWGVQGVLGACKRAADSLRPGLPLFLCVYGLLLRLRLLCLCGVRCFCAHLPCVDWCRTPWGIFGAGS
jgi:hypothetical protein